ncbi:hypothetical protein T484DRAFT_1811734 [Baffinella frigidus]|nr:hypothetical protein T484DRAFT_1811734 [Cryptophyta sp. CCMP2293]
MDARKWAPAFDARKLLIRLAKSKSAADLCRLGIHIKDMNVGHLTDAPPAGS